jgi:hypothetical protein
VLKKEEPGITLNDVGERFNLLTMQEETNKVLKASGLLGSDEAAQGKEEATGAA